MSLRVDYYFFKVLRSCPLLYILSNILDFLVVLVIKGFLSEIIIIPRGYYLKPRPDTILNLCPSPFIKYNILACRVLAL